MITRSLCNESGAIGLIGSVIIGIVDCQCHCLCVRRWLEDGVGDEFVRGVFDLWFVVDFR